MNNSFKKLLLGALICLLHIVAMAADVFQPGVVLVTYKKEATPEQVAAIEAKYSLTLKRRLAAFRISFYDCTANALPPDQLSKVLAAEPSVSGASPDFGAKAQAVDTRFGEQWYLQNTGQTVGDVVGTAGIDINYVKAKSIYAPKQSILVGVVDSGITPLHPDLAGAIFAKSSETFNGLDDDGNGLVDDVFGYNWFDPINSKWPVDTFGHGTMVAGLIAATADNGQGIHGIAPTAKITAHRVFSSLGKMGSPKYANISDIIFAIASSVDDGAKIVNLSLGGGSYSSVEQQFYADLASRNVLVIAAAGNGGSDGVGDNNDVTPTYPSNYGSSAIIAVAAIDQKGVLAEFSNYGPTSVDIAAPGTNILSTDVTRKTIHAPVFSTLTGGWAPYRLAGTDFSYSQWGFYNGWVRDRIDGSTSYRASTDTFLLSPRINLSDSYGTMVSFTGVSNLADDYAWLESSSDGFNWETAYVFPKSGGSSSLKADLADYDFSSLYLRFRIKTNSYNQSNGVLIKDLKVTSVDVLDEQNPSYTITQGTSFSAPIVSGVAAMVWMHRPELTAAEVKAVILDSARKLPSLTGKVVTGGMVDAEAALKLADLRTGNVLPTLPGQPSSGSYLDGASLNLSVISTPGLPVTYQWRKNGVNISGATLSSYSIAVLRISDAGNFDVVVTSLAGSVTSSVAQVTVSARPPAITSHPALPSSAMVAGDSYEVSVSTSGTAPFYYQWMKNGLAIAGATSDRLSFSPLSSAQAGAYSVKVGNAAGFVVSNSINVAVLTRPSFTTDLPTAPISLTAGGARMIYVLATGVPAPTYQWRKNGVNIPGATLYYYVALAGATEGANTYDVVITNSAGSATSAAATVTTNVPVTVTSAPAARNVVAGAEANFSVTAAGTGPFTYQWLKNGLNIAGATNSTYSLAAASTADAGSYSVKVTGPVGPVTSVGATLSVLGFTTNLPTAPISLVAGSSRMIYVLATGVPVPTYQWRKNGVNIPGATLYYYVALAGTVEGANTYDVVITNSAGSVTSAAATVTTNVPVTVASAPAARNVVAGAEANFSVTAAGTGPFTYQWLKNGLNIAGATNSTYSLAAASTADAGSYSVKVTGPVGPVTSVGATLSVLGFTTNLPTAPISLVAGSSRMIYVLATGVPVPTYQWRKNGVNIPGATLYYYVALAGTVEGANTYDVVITNSAGSVTSAAATVTTNVPVTVASAPAARNVVAGAEANFSVTAAGTGPFTYQWLKNGLNIVGATNSTYSLAAASTADAGSYSVKVTGPVGPVTSVGATLSVLGFTTNLPTAPISLVAGSSRMIYVLATGVPVPTYQWRKNGVNIPGATLYYYVALAGTVEGANTYDVVITNSAGSVTSAAATVTTNVPATVTSAPAARNVVAGASTSFSVTAAGTGPFTYQWMKNGLNIVGATNSTYSVAAASTADAGSYSVKVTNPVGSVTSVAAPLSVLGFTTNLPTAPISLVAGSSRMIYVLATGVPVPTYQWRKNGVNIPGATLYYYVALAGATEGANTYDVVITNSAGSATSAAATVTTNVPVTVTSAPAARNVVAGAEANFSVTAAGTGPFTYQWMKNGLNIVGATNSTYSLAAASMADAGIYSVKVTGPVGPVTSVGATLSVLGFTTNLPTAPISLVAGSSRMIYVLATGVPVPTYQWRKNGVNIPGATLYYYVALAGATEGANTYDVVITNSAGSATSAAATVTTNVPVTVTSAPAARNVVAGAEANFSVTAAGTGPFTYQWMKNGLNIVGATNSTYSLAAASMADAGIYSVKVTGPVGPVTSVGATLSVLGFTTNLPTAPISLVAGSSRMIYVLATGVPVPTYQWRKNGVNIPGATLYYYVALAGTVEGANTYDVVITNSAGSVTSAAATVTTNVPVTVASAPAARNVVAGAEANFSVTAAGTGPFTYQWLKNGLAIAGATNSTYSLAAASTADAGSYSVKVTNPVGSVTSSGALLSVIAPFTISAQPLGGLSSVNVSAGGSTTLSVVAAGIGPFSYQWRKNGMSISGAISSAYTVPAGSVEGSASYDVVITGPVSSLASNSVRITTCVPVVITQQPSAVVRAVGQPASFSVAATGTAPLSYQWLKNGLNIAGATGSSYSIPSTVTADAASYSVKVTGPVGAATSSSVALTLNIAPAVSTQPLNAYKALGQSASFSVVASGTGPFTYQWSKDGNAIAGANAATYSIAVVGNTDVGRYSVSVANAVGAVLSQEAELVIVTAPSILIQPMAVNATTASTTRSYRAIYFGFNHGPEGWSAVPWSGKDGDWPTSGWYWNDQIDEGLTESNLEGAAGGGETVSPLISLVGLASPELRFRVGTAGAFAIHVSTDKINWTPLFNIPAGAVTSNDPLSVSLAAFAGSSRYLRFTSTSGTWLDEVEIWGTGLAKEIVELSVATQGEGLTYQWYKDGVAVTGATSRGYVIADATVSTTAGSYTVKVSNAAGSVTSAAAKVGLAPAIAAQPIALNKASGQSASFSVAATGTGPLTYQWSKDGVQIAGATAASYSISAVSAQHIGNYSVTISNALGQATSQSVGLSVTLPPAITTQPASYTVPIEELGIYADTSFDFESGMQGWVASAGPNNQASATWVHTVSSGGGGTVRGLYCNNNSSSSAVRYITSPLISLAGITAPYVSYVSGYTSYTMTLQGNLQVEASADGVNWEFLYPPSPPSYGSPFTAGGPGSTLSSLSKYAGGNVYLRFKASGPNTGFWLDDVVVSGYKYPSGKTVSFSVTATGDGNAYQWFKNGVAVAGATAASFKVDDCRAAASLGSYTVKVTNVAGSVTSSAAVLAVPVPVITSQPQSYSGSWPSSSREVILRNGFDLGSEGWGPVGAGYPGWLWNDQRFEDGGQPSASSLEGNGYIRSPLISLAGVSGSSVTFDVSTYQAVCTLDASIDGVTWTALYSTVGSAVSEKSKTVSLAAYDGRNVYLRFYAPATGAALLDNVEVSGFSRAHTMTAAVSGFGCAYQWYKNGVAISGATAASYRISDVALAASAGSYTVRVTNAAGSVTSNAAAVPTFAAPVIVSQPSSLSVLGSTYVPYTVKNYTFTYGAEGWTYGSNFGNQAAYHWDWDSITGGITDRLYGSYYASYTDTYTQSPWISLLGVSSPVLYFTASHDLYPDSLDALDVQTSSDGVYWTTLRSIYGNGSGVYSVSLAGYQWTGCYIRYRLRSSPLYNAYGITIFDTVVSGTVVSLGQSASFSVGLSASAGCTFQWYKNNIAISGANSSSYYISNTYASDAGVYKVVVTNPVGSVTSASATLTVR